VIVGVLATLVAAAPAGATFAGTNGRIAYDSGGDISTINADGTGQTKLTTSGGNSAPSFSPDGRRIAFSHRVHRHYEIVVMKADGTGKKALTSGASDFAPAYSPDGKRIAFSRSLQTRQYQYSSIFVMRSNGSHLTRVTQNAPAEQFHDGVPEFSPNGKRVVYEADGPEENDVALVNLRHTQHSHVINSGLDPSFAPDGNRILFSDPSSFSQLGLMDLDGQNAEDFTSNSDENFSFNHSRYSPDGTQIVFEGDTYSPPPPTGGTFSDDIYIVTADGSGMTQLTHDGISRNPDWGPAR
jgi:TolB protein